jgi:heat-inducible transcriptional repressor
MSDPWWTTQQNVWRLCGGTNCNLLEHHRLGVALDSIVIRPWGHPFMLDERKTEILRAVIREYIRSAQPVGSAHVARAPGVSVSSATIRNEMAVLEQEGFLHQPHTSAGRVPTDKGYRYFVDHLSPQHALDSQRVEAVHDFFETTHGAVGRLLSDTSRLLASLTNYAAVVVRPAAEASVVRSLQLVPLSSRMAMVVAVLANGTVESEAIELAPEVNDAHIAATTAHLTAHQCGGALVTEIASSGDETVDQLCAVALGALVRKSNADDSQAFVGGASQLARVFDAVDIVRNVLQVLEHQELVVGLVHDVISRGQAVAIGAEHGYEPLAACSVVVKPYVVDGQPVGTIGVLGPTRMDYPNALATVELVSEQLGRTLSDGQDS